MCVFGTNKQLAGLVGLQAQTEHCMRAAKGRGNGPVHQDGSIGPQPEKDSETYQARKGPKYSVCTRAHKA